LNKFLFFLLFQYIAGASGTVTCNKGSCYCLCTSPITPAAPAVPAVPATPTNYLANYYAANPYNYFNNYFNSIFSNFPALFSPFNYWPFTPYARPAATYPVIITFSFQLIDLYGNAAKFW
jgi:hypothetical protein